MLALDEKVEGRRGLHGRDFGDAATVAAAGKTGGQPGVDDLEGIAFRQDAAAQTQNIAVVVETREARGLDAGGGESPDAAHLACRDGGAVPGGTHQDPTEPTSLRTALATIAANSG